MSDLICERKIVQVLERKIEISGFLAFRRKALLTS